VNKHIKIMLKETTSNYRFACKNKNNVIIYSSATQKWKSNQLVSLLCWRPTGRIMHLARLSVCPSVHLSHTGSNSKTKKRRKIKIGIDVPHNMSKWNANFQFERSKIKVTGCKDYGLRKVET